MRITVSLSLRILALPQRLDDQKVSFNKTHQLGRVTELKDGQVLLHPKNYNFLKRNKANEVFRTIIE